MIHLRRSLVASTWILIAAGSWICTEAPTVDGDAAPPPGQTAELAYRSAITLPPADWNGPVFALSHDYPSSDPGRCPETACGWLAQEVDFDAADPTWENGWDAYLASILAYVKEGQTLAPAGWQVEVNGGTRWYHVPWMAFDPKVGREFVHGMTNERTAKLSDLLGPDHDLPNASGPQFEFETWAFGVYNPWGAYAIGRSWDGRGDPVTAGEPLRPAGLPFPEGTLVAKLLFTTATPDEVDYLAGSPEWTVDRHVDVGGCERQPQSVRLVQMDVAVVDERSPTRWVYGTFGYNGTLAGESPWDRLSPLGVQWANDERTFPAVARAESVPAHQSVLAPIDIYEHFGCERRLAGPVDNRLASCMACHGNGYAHLPVGSETIITGSPSTSNVPPIYGFPGICTDFDPQNPENVNVEYFRDRPFGETWERYPDTMSMDTSLQLLVAFSSYGTFKTNGEPTPCTPAQQ